jgi:hypothetical protein
MTNVSLNNQGLVRQGISTLGQNDLNGQSTLTGLDALLAQPSLIFNGANMRGLSGGPAPEPAPDDGPPIVVEGKLEEFDISAYVDSAGKFPGEIMVTGPSVFILRKMTVPKVTTQVDDPKNKKAVEEVAKKLEQKLVEMGEKISNLDDKAILVLKDGTTMTGAEVKAAWADAKFVVTDRDLGSGTFRDNKTDNKAFARADGRSKTITVNYAEFNRASKIPGAVTYMIAHELGHITTEGYIHTQMMNAKYQTRVSPYTPYDPSKHDYAGSPEAIANEKFAHKFAQSLLGALGEDVHKIYEDLYGK